MAARRYSSTLEESAIIERVARIVSSVRGTKPDYTYLAAELEQAIPFDVFGVVLLRHDRQAIRITVCQRKEGVWTSSYHQHPLEESKLKQILQAPRLIVNDYPDGLDDLPYVLGDALSSYHQLRSTLIIPLMVEERVLGTLELGSVDANTYADQNLQRLVSAVVRVLATAIESAQRGGSDEIQNRQRQALKVVSNSLASKMDLPTILNQIVTGVAKALSVASAIFMLDRGGSQLSLEAQSGLDGAVLSNFLKNRRMSINESCIIGQTLKRRAPQVSQDIVIDERFPDNAFFSALGMHSIFSYPLATDNTVYGALLLCSPEAGGFTPLKADILSLFANQATVAIHNGLLLESAQQRSRFQRAIEQLDLACKERTIEGTQEDDLALLEQVRQEAQHTFGVSFTSLLRFISDYLLTQGERNLQSLLVQEQEEQVALQSQTQKDPFADTLELLTETAEAALVRAGMLGELGRLLMQLKQSTNWVRDAWFVVDLNGDCNYMNPAAEVLCDVHLRRELSLTIEQVFEKLLPRIRNIDEVRGYLQDFMQGSTYRQEMRCVLATETVRTYQTQSSYPPHASVGAPSDYHYQFIRYPLYNQQGQPEANALQVHDVTQQVRDERNMSALLSSVSHDLRTPLTTIKAAVTGLLQADVAWSEVDRRAMLEDIDNETDHLTVMVNALVELSRIEMGALILEKEWCDVLEVGYGALRKMKRAFTTSKVRFYPQLPLPLVYADHVQLERVFYNLIENALRHSPENAEVQVLLDVITNGTKMLRVRVIDWGEGIPEHEREHLFQSLQSLRAYGNGLGLAICKGIVDAHQGRIWVSAPPGGQEALEPLNGPGSCFIFTLPVHPYSALQKEEGINASVGEGETYS